MPRITFGMIVLNGEPFIRFALRALYDHAHEIIVVEGASPFAAGIATADGHSEDETLSIIREFIEREDPERKVRLITAEDEGHPNGFWPGEKDEQSSAYAKRATGNWLWQVDVDEFYHSWAIDWIKQRVLTNPAVTAVSVHQRQFWGGIDWTVDGWYLRHYGGGVFHRIFRWAPGYRYSTHRPPTVVDGDGIDLRTYGWYPPQKLAAKGIFLYHYSLVFQKQVVQKSHYYSRATWGNLPRMDEWATANFAALQRPFRVHNVYRYPSWLEQFHGEHPRQAVLMWSYARRGAAEQMLRPTEDIQRLLRSRRYRIGRLALKIVGFPVCQLHLWLVRAAKFLPSAVRRRARTLLRINAGADLPRRSANPPNRSDAK